jgi:hypothetical protein
VKCEPAGAGHGAEIKKSNFGKGSIMKTTRTMFTTSLVLAASLMAGEVEAKGISGHSFSAGSSHGSTFGTAQNFHQTTFRNATSKPSNQSFVNRNLSNGLSKGGSTNNTTKLGQGNKLNLNQKLTSKGNKGFEKLTYSKGKKNWKSGKFWWGFGGFCWGGWCGWGGYCNDWYCGCWSPEYCYEPWYYSPCYNICSEYYVPEYGSYAMAPAVATVQIVNPAETQTTLGFAVNGQTYSLDAGKTQELQLTGNTVIEFDRGGSENDPGRYTLSGGVYRFASTPQGWELYKASSATPADTVAAN